MGVRVGKVGIGVGVPVGFGVLLGRMVAVGRVDKGVQVACKAVGVADGTVGTAAILAIVGSGVSVAMIATILALAMASTWAALARNRGETRRSRVAATAIAATINSAAVRTLIQLLKQPFLEFF